MSEKKNESAEAPENNLDERIQRALKTVASNLYAFRNGGRTGTFRFEVHMKDGVIAENGFVFHLEEIAL